MFSLVGLPRSGVQPQRAQPSALALRVELRAHHYLVGVAGVPLVSVAGTLDGAKVVVAYSAYAEPLKNRREAVAPS